MNGGLAMEDISRQLSLIHSTLLCRVISGQKAILNLITEGLLFLKLSDCRSICIIKKKISNLFDGGEGDV